MNYLNLPTSTAQNEFILKASHQQIGIWFLLLCYCHQQLNNGMIKGCQDWPDEVWMRIAGCHASEIATESPLWHFSGMVLVVHLYDAKAEELFLSRRKLGKQFADKRWAEERKKKKESGRNLRAVNFKKNAPSAAAN